MSEQRLQMNGPSNTTNINNKYKTLGIMYVLDKHIKTMGLHAISKSHHELMTINYVGTRGPTPLSE